MLPLFTITIFLGAVLVFGVQPIAARMLLPSFGGSPAVWSATSVFFQIALLAGYGYSFALTRTLAPRRQSIAHLVALLVPLVFLPLSLPVLTDPNALPPALSVIGILAVSLGIPFAVASTTGPLIQRWFSLTGHRAGRDPYFLYAASNAGSLLILLAYPLLIEPRLGLAEQSSAWSIGYVGFAALSGACALVVMRQARGVREPMADSSTPQAVPGPGWTMRGRWIALAAVPSALSLGATAYISTDIAAVPLLWIAPLSLYLLSFIIAFSTRIRLTSGHAGRLLPWVAAALVIPSGGLIDLPIWAVITVHLTFLLVAATMCHTRLAEERPAPSHLTEFYLLVAIGGALGGIFVSLIAPLIFDAVWEYPIAIALALLLRPRLRGRPSVRTMIIGATTVLAALVIVGWVSGAGQPLASPVATVALAVAVGVILLAMSRMRPVLALTVFAILGVSVWGGGGSIYADRTFFGVYRVTSGEGQHSLVHGTTIHGLQRLDPRDRQTATTYYHATGPIGQIFSDRGARIDRVGVVGLGVGTVASYGRSGQQFTFFEIDPAMVAIAENPDLFTFLADSEAEVKVVVADGRLGVAGSDERYGLLIMDAFSSDAIPVHLLTREAIATYADHLEPGGLIAINVTNRFLDLEPVVARVAHVLGMSALAQYDTTISAREAAAG
ncbi:MAG: fused MFS/spermidine synthase, partial [Candidatus Limnocylindria bacterium]